MSADPVRRHSPLASAAAATAPAPGAAVALYERRFLGHYNLRADAGEAARGAALRSALGFDLPLEPNAVAGAGGVTAFWLGPDEWLVMTPYEPDQTPARKIEAALDGGFAALTDLSGGQTVIVVAGPRAGDVLAKGCPLDLHARCFAVGTCAQTLLAKAHVLLFRRERETFEIVVRRSFADHLWRWLQDAALEYSDAGEAAS